MSDNTPTQVETDVPTAINEINPVQLETAVTSGIPDPTDEVKEKPRTNTEVTITVGSFLNADGASVVTRCWKLQENTHPRYL